MGMMISGDHGPPTNICKTLIGVYSIIHLMHTNQDLAIITYLHTNAYPNVIRLKFNR